MFLRDIASRLTPHCEEEPKFRDLVARLSYLGLRTISVVEIAAPLLMLMGHLAVEPSLTAALPLLWQMGAMGAVGLLTMGLSHMRWAQPYARLAAAVSVWISGVLLMATTIRTASAGSGSSDDYILTGIAMVVLTAVTTVPFRPLQTLVVGVSLEASYAFFGWLAIHLGIPVVPGQGPAHHTFLIMLAILATGITANNYQHLKAEFDAAQEALRVTEALAGAQLRAQLAENAISIGKLAAALTHEINTPLGTLRSSVGTLMTLADRQLAAPPERREALGKMREELGRSIHESAERIENVVMRLRRFISLEEAELKLADINELISDVTLLYQQQIEAGKIRMEFDLERPIPPLTCRPQLLSAVFSSLVSNAIKAVNGDGRIAISTRRQDSTVEVTVADNGRGMTPEEADQIFELTFKVDGSRVASSHWSLFNTRQIVYEHGGDIRVDTAAGKGTAVHVSLPLVPG